MGEEAIDLARVEIARVAASEGEEAADPAEIRLLGTERVVPHSNGVLHALEQLRRFGASGGRGGVGDDRHGVNAV